MRGLKWLVIVCIFTLGLTIADGEHAGRGAEATDDEVATRPIEVKNLTLVSQLTGAGSPARTDEPWNVYGTDLGFSFEQGDKIYVVFGDTWGRGGSQGPDWRSNFMAVVEPHPEHGYVITEVIADENGEAKELLSSLKQPQVEYTVIPTAGIAVDDRMYLHYMSINDWVDSGWGYKHPALNGAGLAYSDDRGQAWLKDETARWEGDTDFGQAAMVADGDYIYMFGTPSGRFGAAKLLRAPGDDLLLPDQYEYWTGETWFADASQAVTVVPAPVGELSVRWSPYHERWLMMYLNDVTHNIVLRTAERLEGPWDDERVVVSAAEYPTLYGGFMLPITGPDVYFMMSTFTDYQVFVMRMTL